MLTFSILIGLSMLLALGFGIVLVTSLAKIKREYGVDIWRSPKHALRMTFGGKFAEITDEEGLALLRRARVGIIGWNICLAPVVVALLYWFYRFASVMAGQ